MNLAIIDRIQEQARTVETKTRKQVDKTRDQIKGLQSKGQNLVNKQADNIKDHAEAGRRNITRAEAQALDVVSNWLERAHKATGEKTDWLDKGSSFIDQVAKDIRMGALHVDELPIDNYDALGVKKIKTALVGIDAGQRDMIRAYETTHKNRVTVFREIDRLEKLETN